MLCCTRGNDSHLCLQPCTLALALDTPRDYDHSRMAFPGLLPLVHPSLGPSNPGSEHTKAI